MPDRDRSAGLWVGPFALAAIVALAVILLLTAVRGERTERSRLIAAENRETVAQALRTRALADREFLTLLASRMAAGLSREDFESRASQYADTHRGLSNITYADESFVITWTAPFEANKAVIGLALDLPEPARASRRARDTRLPAYTNSFRVVQDYDAFEVYVPVYDGERFAGTLGGIYNLNELLAEVVPAGTLESNHVELVSGTRVAASAGLPEARAGERTDVEWLALAGSDLGVQVAPERAEAGVGWADVLGGLSAALALGVAWGTWRLRLEAARRSAADAALLENRSLLAAIIEGTTDAVYVKDCDGRYLLFNRAAAEITGVSQEAALGHDDTRLFPLDSARAVMEGDRGVMDAGVTRTYEEHITLDSGDQRDFLSTKGPVRDSNGRVTGLFGIARDVTELKAAERALREQSERLRLALDLSKQDIWDFDVTTGTLYTTPMYAAMIGADPETLHETVDSWRERVHPDDRARVVAILEDCLAGRRDDYRAEFRLRREDGSYLWLSSGGAVSDRDGDGRPLRMTGTHIDVTERHESEAERARSEIRLRQTLDSLMEGVHIVGTDWRYRYVNDAYVTQTKYSREELMAHTIPELYPGIEATEGYRAYRKCLDERLPSRIEIEFVFPDESIGWFEMLFQPVEEGAFVLSTEITDRKRVEQELREANVQLKNAERALSDLNRDLEERVRIRTAELAAANKELEAFAYSVSHDLRAPLRHVTGFAQLLVERSREQLDESGRRYVDTIAEAGERMGRLIDDLLRFSRIGRVELQLEDVDMNASVREALAELAPQIGERAINWEFGDLPVVRGDVALLRQVWVNLLGNAVKYTSKNETARIEVGVSATDGEYHFWVRDDGVGFDPEYADQLFRVFHRLHSAGEFEGSGIGLANVQRIITRLGGRVWAESASGEGATFSFSLSRNEEA